VRSTLPLAIILAISARAGAQLSSCSNASLPPSLSAITNGSSVTLRLQYGASMSNTTTTPVVSRIGNTIGVYSQNVHRELPILPPIECITLDAAAGDLPPGDYTVNWTVAWMPQFDCGTPPCFVADPLPLRYSTQFTVLAPVEPPSVPALSDWILIALAAIFVTAGLMRIR